MTLGHIKADRGFTLIELLVVIAIIGILSSVVLASLNTARTRGNAASVKSNMATISVQAELNYDSNNPNQYVGTAVTATCPTTAIASSMFDTTTVQALAAAEAVNGTGSMVCNATTGASGAWAISSPFPGGTGATSFWCVDSTGAKRGHTTALGSGAVTCPTT